MDLKNKLAQDVDDIVRLLQGLQYSGVQCRDGPWLHRLLFVAGPPRQQLLQWLLVQLDPLTTDGGAGGEGDHAAAANALLAVLVPLGLCRTSDAPLLLGTAPPAHQARLWLFLLHTLTDRRRLLHLATPADLHHRSDNLLHDLCRSRALAQVTKRCCSSVLPLDLQERHRASSSGGGRQDTAEGSLVALQQRIASATEEKRQLDQRQGPRGSLPSSTDCRSAQAALHQHATRLDQTGRLFGDLYSSHLRSWLSDGDAAQLQQAELPDTGEAVHEAWQQLNRLTEVLSMSSELSERGEQLRAAQCAVEKTLHQPPPVTAALHRLAALAATNTGEA